MTAPAGRSRSDPIVWLAAHPFGAERREANVFFWLVVTPAALTLAAGEIAWRFSDLCHEYAANVTPAPRCLP